MKGPMISGGLNGKTLNTLIDFNFVFNTDIGLIRFIQENYQDDRVFLLDVLNKSDRDILSLLYNRSNWNPLSIISTEDNMKDIDDLYYSFFKEYKIKIISKSVVLSTVHRFMQLIESYGRSFGIVANFSVSDSIEEGALRERYSGFNYCYYNNKPNIKARDPFYVKDFNFFLKNGFEDIINKKIYLFPFRYSVEYINFEQNNLTMKNEFSFVGDTLQHKLMENTYGN